MNKSLNNSSRLAVLCSICLAICFFLYKFGFRILDPTHIGFIFRMGGTWLRHTLDGLSFGNLPGLSRLGN